MNLGFTQLGFTKHSALLHTQGSHSHILITGGGGPSDFFGSEILAKSGLRKMTGFFWVVKKNRGIFLGCENRTKGYFCVC